MKDATQPRILSVCTTACSKLFVIESVRLQFVNGSEAEYERVSSAQRHGAVIIVPILESGAWLLVKEYMVGLERYEFGLPKGLMQEGESSLQAAKRELMEELGLRASRLVKLGTLSLAAGFMCYETDVVAAMTLAPCARGGDEPESLQIHPCGPQELDALVFEGRLRDARTLAAVYLARTFLHSGLECGHRDAG